MDKPLILLVEDDPAAHHVMELGLGNLWDIDGVHSLQAMRNYLSTGKKPDAVILDSGLPDSKRESTMDAVQSLVPHIPVVVISGHDDTALTILQGAQDFLLKGKLSFEEVFQTVVKAIERHKVRGRYERMTEAIQKLKELAQKKLESDSNEYTPLPKVKK